MMVSACCKEYLYVVSGNEGTSYYACTKCNHACDPICPIVPFDGASEAEKVSRETILGELDVEFAT